MAYINKTGTYGMGGIGAGLGISGAGAGGGKSGAGNTMTKSLGIGAGLGAIGSGLFNLFGDQEDPSQAGDKYFNQIPDVLKQYLQPYINQGQSQYGDINKAYGEMMNPNELMNRLGQGYTKSPGYDWKLGQGEQAINNAAASGGMLGTPQHQQQAGQLAENMSYDDYMDYLTKALGLYGSGVAGKQGFYTGGREASGTLAENLAQALSNQGSLSYQGAIDRNNQESGGMGDIFSGLGTVGSLLAFA